MPGISVFDGEARQRLSQRIYGALCVCDRLADQRELLAPAVEHWQHVQQMEADVNTTKLNLLSEQQQHGSRLLQLQSHKVCHGGFSEPFVCTASLCCKHAPLWHCNTHECILNHDCLQLVRALAARLDWHTSMLPAPSTAQHTLVAMLFAISAAGAKF
jgi:hypothetical protein